MKKYLRPTDESSLATINLSGPAKAKKAIMDPIIYHYRISGRILRNLLWPPGTSWGLSSPERRQKLSAVINIYNQLFKLAGLARGLFG